MAARSGPCHVLADGRFGADHTRHDRAAHRPGVRLAARLRAGCARLGIRRLRSVQVGPGGVSSQRRSGRVPAGVPGVRAVCRAGAPLPHRNRSHAPLRRDRPASRHVGRFGGGSPPAACTVWQKNLSLPAQSDAAGGHRADASVARDLSLLSDPQRDRQPVGLPATCVTGCRTVDVPADHPRRDPACGRGDPRRPSGCSR